MRKTRVGVAAGALAVLGGGVMTGVLLSGGGAVAADEDPTVGASAAAGSPRHDHLDVTGAELTRVTDAVEAEKASVTVESVRKDPDGSYDVFGTDDGERVMLEVSADLAEITEHTGGRGGPGDHGGRGGPDGAADPDGAAPSSGATTSAYVVPA